MNEEDFINFIHRIKHLNGLLVSFIDKELDDMKVKDIATPHFVVLSIIAREKSILFKDVFEHTKKAGIKSNNPLVYIVTTDYIKKIPCEEHKSSYLIELSDKGKMIINDIYIRTMNSFNKWIDDQYGGDDFSYKKISFLKSFEQYMDHSFIFESALEGMLEGKFKNISQKDKNETSDIF
jgi:DNA-binding MarR family transcriptional regulator